MIIMRKTKKFPLSQGLFCGVVPGARETRELTRLGAGTGLNRIIPFTNNVH